MSGSLCMGEEAYSFLSQAVHNMWMFCINDAYHNAGKDICQSTEKILIRMRGRF